MLAACKILGAPSKQLDAFAQAIKRLRARLARVDHINVAHSLCKQHCRVLRAVLHSAALIKHRSPRLTALQPLRAATQCRAT